jgi:glycosyltransferase involved in cell wall biosynthesis
MNVKMTYHLKPKRILHVTGAMNRAGTETMLMNIYRYIDRNKIQFDFISYSKREAHYDKEIESLGGRIIHLNKTRSVKELYQAIKKHGPYDVVHTHTLFHCGLALLAAFLAGVKIRIAHAHTTFDEGGNVVRKIYRLVMRRIIQIFSTKLLACSNGAGMYLFGKKGVYENKYEYFPNTIDDSALFKVTSSEISKLKKKERLENYLVIGHIGRFIPSKNHLFLLHILKEISRQHPNTKLLLVGDGDLREKMEEKAKQMGIDANIHFVGVRRDIPALLHCMDVFVFPSIYEGLGLVLLEAQACGIPCLVSEAIQPEADLQLGLMYRLELSDGPEKWVEQILKLKDKKLFNQKWIQEKLQHSGHTVTGAIQRLIDIYQISDGERIEQKAIDRIL